ncbi:peptidase M50 [Chlorobium phaeobacteroides DSM 266]|uniref:Peptidase M50 n=2 Tax=Chlorobium phaeobacteroides TaxID=1096 RepID=A1BDT6_CHLPD|nr:peptidase M50 [Chlorobium phaeobacteroides DSM 266]
MDNDHKHAMNGTNQSRATILAEQNYPLHIALFLLTALCTLWAGSFWSGHPVRLDNVNLFFFDLFRGLPYAASLLLFLSVHEFGHFFTALHYRMRATLPYYIPVPPLPFLLSLGTMGAVIKIKDRIPNTNALFDTGVSGPLSGFIVSLGLLLFGFYHLPPASWIFTVHPEYIASGGIPNPAPEGTLTLGKNLLWIVLEQVIAPKNLPPMTEMYHYPFLFTGWLGCFVTALNLIPVGQLDGGHVTYAMFGKQGYKKTAKTFMFIIGILGFPSLLELTFSLILPAQTIRIPGELLQWSWPGWMLWFLILSRFIGTDHPPTSHDCSLSASRRAIGWVAIVIFIITFVPVPFGVQ